MIGSGSGIHSLSMYKLGAKEIMSFDYDINSVEATLSHFENAGQPKNWRIMQGSILDDTFVSSLGEFDLVYSWGVLYHTGSMWKAINNALSLVKSEGLFFITIYNDYSYERSMRDKKKYNNSGILW